jgi:AsmA-like C-terminal region
LTGVQASFWHRHRILGWVLGGLFVALAGLVVAVAFLAHRAEPFLRARIVDALSARFHGRVELDSFHLSLGYGRQGRWGLLIQGGGLRIWPEGQPEPVMPLIQLDEFDFQAPVRFKADKPLHISLVRLSGLSIHVPPKSERTRSATPKLTSDGQTQASAPAQTVTASLLSSIIVENIECTNALLVLETDKPGKLPLGFAIAHLRLAHVTENGPMSFNAELTNPRPLGTIFTSGTFGPWQADDPAASPVAGDYRFVHADLATFKGIAGILTSAGHYTGTLKSILVDGEADVPDFQLPHLGDPMMLHTSFHARVDGTDGDTWLDPVYATLGHSNFTVRGQIVRSKPLASGAGQSQEAPEAERSSLVEGGHDIALNIDVQRARMEDFLRLVNHSATPLLTGDVSAKAVLHIPPGKDPVEKRLVLDGSFKLDQAQFTSAKIQNRVQDLSLRGQGKPKDVKTANPDAITSEMQSDFHVANAVVTLPDLQYTVPGAVIQLKGTYALDGGALDFIGTARMQATISQMVGGWKGLLLKPADKLFEKNGAGTQVPVHVGGTRDNPDFGIDFNRMKTTSPQSPAEQP